MTRTYWNTRKNYNRNRNSFFNKEKENELFELNCLKHGHLIQMKYRKEGEKLKIYRDINEDKTKIIYKCYICLEEEINKSNIEKEKIKQILDEKYKSKNVFWALFTLFFGAIAFFGGIVFLMLTYFSVLIVNVVICSLLFKFGKIRLEKIEKLKIKEFEEHTLHILKFSTAEDHVEYLEGEIKKLNLEKKKTIITQNKEKKNTNAIKNSPTFATMQIIDEMPGDKFEYYVKNILIAKNFEKVTVTKASADNGIDIIAYKNNKKIGFQCKRYKKKISNRAIQEVYSGKDYYRCDEAYVVTNSYFTENAKIVAKKLDVKLIDRNELSKWISELN